MPTRMTGLLIVPATVEAVESLWRRRRGRRCWFSGRGEVFDGLPASIGCLAIDRQVVALLRLRLLGGRIGIGKRIMAAARRQIAGGGDDDPVTGKIDLERLVRCHFIEEEPAP